MKYSPQHRLLPFATKLTRLPYFTRCESRTRPWSLHCCIRKWGINKYAHRWCQGEAAYCFYHSFCVRKRYPYNNKQYHNYKIFVEWWISSSVSRNEVNRPPRATQPVSSKKLIEIPVSAHDRSRIPCRTYFSIYTYIHIHLVNIAPDVTCVDILLCVCRFLCVWCASLRTENRSFFIGSIYLLLKIGNPDSGCVRLGHVFMCEMDFGRAVMGICRRPLKCWLGCWLFAALYNL